MKGFLLIVFIILYSFNSRAQQKDITLKSDTIILGKDVPFNDDRGLYPDKDGIYKEPEKFPMFPGGNKALLKFLAKTTKWPDKSGVIDIQGKVLITFVVEKSGILTHFKITKSLDPIFDKEALRAIKLSPRWIPGRVNGKKVRCWYTVPFNFALN